MSEFATGEAPVSRKTKALTGAALATTILAGCSDGEKEGGDDVRAPGIIQEKRSTDHLPDCNFGTNKTITGALGAKAPAEWVYAGAVDTTVKEERLRIYRPIVRIEDGKPTYYTAEVAEDSQDRKDTKRKLGLTALTIKKPIFYAKTDWANGGWKNKPASVVCDPGDAKRPAGTQAVTYENGIIRHVGNGRVYASFNDGAPVITDSNLLLHQAGAIGANIGQAPEPAPYEMIGQTSP